MTRDRTGRAGGFRRNRATVLLAGASVVGALAVVLSAPYRPLTRQAYPDPLQYADSAANVAYGRGYVTYVGGGPKTPYYPPGFSYTLAPFARWAGDFPHSVQLGAKVLAAMYILAVAAAAFAIGGPWAMLVAMLLAGVSPFARGSAAFVMSDAFATALVVAILPLLRKPTTKRLWAAGALAGYAVTVRVSEVVALAALVLVLRGRQRMHVLAGALPFILALGIYQWSAFGSPLQTGYQEWSEWQEARPFALEYLVRSGTRGDGHLLISDKLDGALLEWVCPCPEGGPMRAMSNLTFYPSVLLGLFWIYAPPLVGVIGGVVMRSDHRHPDVRFAFFVSVFTLILYASYFYQGGRFVAAPATFLTIYAAAGIARSIRFGRSGSSDPPERSARGPRPAIRSRAG